MVRLLVCFHIPPLSARHSTSSSFAFSSASYPASGSCAGSYEPSPAHSLPSCSFMALAHRIPASSFLLPSETRGSEATPRPTPALIRHSAGPGPARPIKTRSPAGPPTRRRGSCRALLLRADLVIKLSYIQASEWFYRVSQRRVHCNRGEM